MSAIFISHSSADQQDAAQMKAWLETQGHSSLFLDFDPATGIQAGANWEQTLYRKLRQCQAVIALLSPGWLASRWCFAELVQARERGKAIFLVKVKPVDAAGVFADVQHVDLTARADESYERLRRGLLECGLDPLDAFNRDPKRPPYPGLLAFEEADAAIFFGRDESLAKSIEALDALRRQIGDVPRFVLLLGASGSGKSSLARAGVIPRLKKRAGEWLPVSPLRPQLEPLDELAVALAAAFQRHGQPRAWRELRAALAEAADATPPDGRALLGLTRDLAIAAGRPEATVLLTIDQAEELFGYTPRPAADRFLRLLRAALESADQRLMVLATLRSDFLGEFQNHPALQDKDYGHHVRYRMLTVDPMPLRSVPEVIHGPARLDGLELEDGLVEAMVGDMGAHDALPLLAFTLRRIYERTRADGRMTLAAYEAVGRLEGAVRQEAERLVDEAQPGAEDLLALHAAFVPTLVRITPDGSYVRRRALVEHLPSRVLALLRRFVDARLLVSDRDSQGRETHEVAHEALWRTWPQLSDWLSEDRDRLRLLESVQRGAHDWEQAGRRDDLLVHRDARLRDIDALLASPRFRLPPDSVEAAYVDACRAAQQARDDAARAEHERRLRDAERIAAEQTRAAQAERRTAATFRRYSVIAALLAVVAGVAALLARQQYHEANDANQRVVEVRQLNRHTSDTDARPQRSLLLSVRAAALAGDDRLARLAGIDALRQQLRLIGGRPLHGHARPVRAAAISPDRHWLATGSEDGALRLWDLTAPDPAAQPLPTAAAHAAAVSAMVFSRDGRWLISGDTGGGVRVWDLRGQPGQAGPAFALDRLGAINAIAVSPDGQWLAFGSEGGYLCVWKIGAEGPTQAPCDRWRDDAPVRQVLFSPAGRWLATTCAGACKAFSAPVRLWDVTAAFPDGEPRQLVHRSELGEPSLLAIAFNGDDTRLAVAYGYVAELWDLTQADPPAHVLATFVSGGGWISALALSPDQRWLALGSGGSTDVRLWDLSRPEQAPAVLPGHHGALSDVAFSDDSRWLASGAADGTAALWDLAKPALPLRLLRGHDGAIDKLRLTPGDAPRHLLTWGADADARLWRVADPLADPVVLRGRAGPVIAGMAVSADGEWVATSSAGDKSLMLWSTRDARQPARELPLPSDSHAVAFSPDGRWLAAKSHDARVISLWSLTDASRQPLELAEDAYGDVRTLRFSPDGRWLASGTWNDGASRLNLWDVTDANPPLQPRHACPVDAPVREVAFSADGRFLGMASHGRTARIWDLAAANPCAGWRALPHDDVVYQVALSADGRWAASASFDGKGRLWELPAGAPPRLVREVAFKDRVLQAAFSPDNRWAAFGSWDHNAALLSLADPTNSVNASPIVLSGHIGRLSATAFSPDGRWLATAAEDGTVRLWDPELPAAAPIVLRGHDAAVGHLGFTPDSRWLISGANDGSVRLWRLGLTDLIDVACQTAGRQLTPDEARQFVSAGSPLPCADRR
jgi:WD40 repeat protein